MNAGGTQLRCLGTNDNMTAVTALPNLDFALLEDLCSLRILQHPAGSERCQEYRHAVP